MMLDASKAEQQKALLEAELEVVGLRLNKKPPNVSILRCLFLLYIKEEK